MWHGMSGFVSGFLGMCRRLESGRGCLEGLGRCFSLFELRSLSERFGLYSVSGLHGVFWFIG